MKNFNASWLWFGAAISIAEIMTGSLLAPLGMQTALLIILIGHFIGCLILYAVGYIGAKENKTSMKTTPIAFGKKGAHFFSALNVIQLIGWTAVMMVTCVAAVTILFGNATINVELITVIIVSIALLLWINFETKITTYVANGSIIALLVTMVVLMLMIPSNNVSNPSNEINIALALELSIVMPISWLPLIGDYTSESTNPKQTTLIVVISYFIGSCLMYAFGVLLAVNEITLVSNNSIVIFLVIIISTITTTYLNVYSTGISANAITSKFNPKTISSLTIIIGAIICLVFGSGWYETFLYFISAAFIPMAIILIVEYYILKNDFSTIDISKRNMIIWVLGFIFYQILYFTYSPLGSTLPTIIFTIIVALLLNIKNLRGIKYA